MIHIIIIIRTCRKLIIVMGNLCHSEFNITATINNNYLPSKGEPRHAYTHVIHKETHYKMDKSHNII